ncbi:hypothetical protein ACFX13_046713 [Malus domestica]
MFKRRRCCRFGEHSLPILQSAKPKAALLDPSVLILSNSTAAIAKAQNSSSCIHTCGSGKSAKTVRYPFGFSPGCQIRLNCSENNEITLGKFRVQNVTPNAVFVNLPARCNRRFESVIGLFGPTWNNSLLLQNCSAPQNGSADFVQK